MNDGDNESDDVAVVATPETKGVGGTEVETMNEPRFAALHAADPEGRLREQTRTPAAELMEQAHDTNVLPHQTANPEDSAIAAVLDEHIRRYERQWHCQVVEDV